MPTPWLQLPGLREILSLAATFYTRELGALNAYFTSTGCPSLCSVLSREVAARVHSAAEQVRQEVELQAQPQARPQARPQAQQLEQQLAVLGRNIFSSREVMLKLGLGAAAAPTGPTSTGSSHELHAQQPQKQQRVSAKQQEQQQLQSKGAHAQSMSSATPGTTAAPSTADAAGCSTAAPSTADAAGARCAAGASADAQPAPAALRSCGSRADLLPPDEAPVRWAAVLRALSAPRDTPGPFMGQARDCSRAGSGASDVTATEPSLELVHQLVQLHAQLQRRKNKGLESKLTKVAEALKLQGAQCNPLEGFPGSALYSWDYVQESSSKAQLMGRRIDVGTLKHVVLRCGCLDADSGACWQTMRVRACEATC